MIISYRNKGEKHMKLENKTIEQLRHILESEGFHLPEQWNKYALMVAIRAMKGEQAKGYLTQGCTINYIIGQQPAERLYKLINGVIHYKDKSYDWIEAYDTLEEHDGNNFIVVNY